VYLTLKILKLLAVVTYCSGAVGACFSRARADTERFVYRAAAPAFGLIWILGIGLTHVSEVSILSSWVLGSALCSIVSINALLYLAGKPGRMGAAAGTLALAPLVIAIALMAWRGQPWR
jgi:hypothetical protein